MKWHWDLSGTWPISNRNRNNPQTKTNTENMKREHAKELLPLIAAWADGKVIEYSSDGEWFKLPQETTWSRTLEFYRIKPEPKLRAWKPDEVPVGALARWKEQTATRFLITACHSQNIYAGFDGLSYDVVFRKIEHSTDHGKTWKPCGVEE
jgi:hypothetical protein